MKPTKKSVCVASEIFTLVSKYNFLPADVGNAKDSCFACIDAPSLSVVFAEVKFTSPDRESATTAALAPESFTIVQLCVASNAP